MDMDENCQLTFIGEWFQEEAGIERKFCILYYPSENSLELFDLKTRKTFLKRTKMKEIIKSDFYIGAKLNIFGRQIEILDYGDHVTRSKLAAATERSFIIIHGNLRYRMGEIISVLNDNDIVVSNGRMLTFPKPSVKKFFGKENKSDVKMIMLINNLVHGPCVGLEIMGIDVLERIKRCLTLEESPKEEDIALRRFFEDDDIRNGIYCAVTSESCKSQLAEFFNYTNELVTTVVLNNTTLAIIKPHAVKEGKIGKIITDICQNGFRVTGMRMKALDRINSEEFYEIYRGVLPEYIQMVAQLSSGMCMALELQSEDPTKKNTHAEFRALCGPMDPEIGRHLRPNTLRAKYGKTKVLNALHCTDLPDDCELELEYFFKILE